MELLILSSSSLPLILGSRINTRSASAADGSDMHGSGIHDVDRFVEPQAAWWGLCLPHGRSVEYLHESCRLADLDEGMELQFMAILRSYYTYLCS